MSCGMEGCGCGCEELVQLEKKKDSDTLTPNEPGIGNKQSEIIPSPPARD